MTFRAQALEGVDALGLNDEARDRFLAGNARSVLGW
jgi:predicted TIM-barrel fold metal-dependent hydrolase